jgi:serine/threonine-protein kinase
MQQNGIPGPTLLNNRYRLLAIIAGGGMATVYKAQDTLLNRIVAIKVPRDRASIGNARNAEFERQFREEATSAANLNHPNIVSVYDVGKDVVNGVERQYLVMEFVEGQDLKQAIRNAWATNQAFGVDEAVIVARQVCEGVAFAHRRGLVHCDLKPQNVLLTPEGRVKVADFGIARAFTTSLPEKADVVWGTPQYYAPEQAQGQPPTPASDVYSIGVMLFEMLTGRLPFEGKNAAAHDKPAARRERPQPQCLFAAGKHCQPGAFQRPRRALPRCRPVCQNSGGVFGAGR